VVVGFYDRILDGRIDEARKSICIFDAGVELEVEPGCMAQAESPTHFAAQKPGGAGQTRRDFVRGMAIAEGHEQNLCRAHIRRHAYGRDRDHPYPRVLDLTGDELRHHPLQFGLDALLSRLAGHDPTRDQAIARATSTREKHSI